MFALHTTAKADAVCAALAAAGIEATLTEETPARAPLLIRMLGEDGHVVREVADVGQWLGEWRNDGGASLAERLRCLFFALASADGRSTRPSDRSLGRARCEFVICDRDAVVSAIEDAYRSLDGADEFHAVSWALSSIHPDKPWRATYTISRSGGRVADQRVNFWARSEGLYPGRVQLAPPFNDDEQPTIAQIEANDDAFDDYFPQLLLLDGDHIEVSTDW